MPVRLHFRLKGVWDETAVQPGKVWLNGKPLNPAPSQKVVNHSPDGFAWGYAGSGPAQLALAILLKLLPKDFARSEYQDFKFDVIQRLPQGSFEEREITWEFTPMSHAEVPGTEGQETQE
jgi:hypothetical protein